MHQVIDPKERILYAKFLFKDLLYLFASKHTYSAISICWPILNSFDQLWFFFAWKFCRSAGLAFWCDCFYAAIAIKVIPSLNEVFAAIKLRHDCFCLPSLQCQSNGSIPISLLCICFNPSFFFQLLQVTVHDFTDVHAMFPFVFQEV